MTRKREVLSLLFRDELHAAADSRGLEPADWRSKDATIDALSDSTAASPVAILADLKWRFRRQDFDSWMGVAGAGFARAARGEVPGAAPEGDAAMNERRGSDDV